MSRAETLASGPFLAHPVVYVGEIDKQSVLNHVVDSLAVDVAVLLDLFNRLEIGCGRNILRDNPQNVVLFTDWINRSAAQSCWCSETELTGPIAKA